MIGDIDDVSQHYHRSRRWPWLAIERQRDWLRELRVVELAKGVFTECERRLELRHERILWPFRFDGVGGRGIRRRQCGFHRAKIVAEEIVVARQVLRDVPLSLIHISEPTRQAEISYAVFC